MPTGYTAKLCEEEQSFSEFVLGCARAFGACISQRDDPQDDLPLAPEKSTYHHTQLEVAEKELLRLKNFTANEKERLGTKEQIKQIFYYEESIRERKIVRNRLLKMIKKVKSWKPPSIKHNEFKKFMIEQLESTLRLDGDIEYYKECLTREQGKNNIDYYNEAIKNVRWEIKHHKKHDKKASDRSKEQIQWINKLYKSLESDPSLSHLLLKKGIK